MTVTIARILREFLIDPRATRHGYELMKATGYPSGKLYPVLARLVSAGWTTAQPGNGPAHPRQRITRAAHSAHSPRYLRLRCCSGRTTVPRRRPGGAGGSSGHRRRRRGGAHWARAGRPDLPPDGPEALSTADLAERIGAILRTAVRHVEVTSTSSAPLPRPPVDGARHPRGVRPRSRRRPDGHPHRRRGECHPSSPHLLPGLG